jgi:hypothetical protein
MKFVAKYVNDKYKLTFYLNILVLGKKNHKYGHGANLWGFFSKFNIVKICTPEIIFHKSREKQ